jgi:hypothetical protein
MPIFPRKYLSNYWHSYAQDLKLGLYMKVPKRSLFWGQMVASIWACFVQIAVVSRNRKPCVTSTNFDSAFLGLWEYTKHLR